MFDTKFFCIEAKFTFAGLGRTRKYLREDVNAYMKRFHERALDYCDPVVEDVLVDACLHGITEEYHGMKVARRTNECVKRIVRSSGPIRPI